MDNKKIISIVIIAFVFLIAATIAVISTKPQMHKKIMLEKIILKKEASKK